MRWVDRWLKKRQQPWQGRVSGASVWTSADSSYGLWCWQRRNAILMVAKQKVLLPLSVVVLLVLLIGLYTHDDPSKFPVGPAVVSSTSQYQLLLAKLPWVREGHKETDHDGGRAALAASNGCRPKSPEQLLLHSAQRPSLMFKHSRSLPNYFLYTDDKGYKRMQVEKTMTSSSRPRVVFMHHNKAGGTSVKSCLKAIAEGEGLLMSPAVTGFKRQQFHQQSSVRKVYSKFDIVAGGYAAGMCTEEMSTSRPCLYLTMLRHPLDRLISSYYYCRHRPGDQLCASSVLNASAVSLAEWAEHQSGFLLTQLSYTPADCKADRLASLSCWYQMRRTLRQRSCSKADLVQLAGWVADQLDSVFTALGIVEQMDASMQMWQKATGLPFVKYCSGAHRFERNLATDHAGKAERRQQSEARIEAASDPAIQEALKLDLIVYEKAKQIFAKQLAVYQQMTSLR